MDALRGFLEDVKKNKHAKGNFLGFLHLMIGRRISRPDGTVISAGLSWRDLANWLRKIRWDTEDVLELGLDPDKLAPKDRERLWYAAISRAGVDTEKAAQSADRLAEELRKQGLQVSERPGQK
ncbi:MAG: hypothetical protein FJ271_09680 [Planctomycetes bacterium]|nr:hypothetical protein [Planctomycetota bacterium]